MTASSQSVQRQDDQERYKESERKHGILRRRRSPFRDDGALVP